jgi:hypothetical protein
MNNGQLVDWGTLSSARTFDAVMLVWELSEPCSDISHAALWKAFRLAQTPKQLYTVLTPAKRDSELARLTAKALTAFPPFLPFKNSWTL